MLPFQNDFNILWSGTEVNPNGGKEKNIAMDLQMEFVDKEYKGFFNEQIKKKWIMHTLKKINVSLGKYKT
jgi:hypothetical protein